jgi:hypothetical protein
VKTTLTRLLGARPMRTLGIAGAAVVTTLALVAPSTALAHNRGHGHGAVPPPPANPTSANQIQNIDQVKTAIKAYYGDTVTDQVDPYAGDGVDKQLHTFSPTSAYAHEMGGIERDAARYLNAAAHHRHSGKKAILLDVDDTTLNTYSYEIYSNFVYDPTSNAAFVNAAIFPATPGMPQLVNWAKSRGYTVFFLTGRPESQRAGTVANLQNQGYPVQNDQLYLKDYTVDTWLSSCAPSCTTIQYKSLTRAHVESLGYDIVGNFGDQYSDLSGGHADRTFKLPNPMYYLP